MAGQQHDFAMILQLILEQYQLPVHGDHGVCHWARVWTNGHAIASQTEADPEIVSLFALFHDEPLRATHLFFIAMNSSPSLYLPLIHMLHTKTTADHGPKERITRITDCNN